MNENQPLKTSRNKGIATVKHFKINAGFFDLMVEKAAEYEDGLADLCREALTTFLTPTPLSLVPKTDFSDRTHSLTAKVSVDTGYFFGNLAIVANTQSEILLGELATLYALNQAHIKDVDSENFISIPTSTEDIAMIDTVFGEQSETMIYESFLIDVLRAGLSTKKAEIVRDSAAYTHPVNNEIVEIDLSEIESSTVRESLIKFGFDENRYLTIDTEKKSREMFEAELRNQLETKQRELERLQREIPENEEVIKDFQRFINSTKIVINKLVEAGSLKNVFFRESHEEILKNFDEKFRKIL